MLKLTFIINLLLLIGCSNSNSSTSKDLLFEKFPTKQSVSLEKVFHTDLETASRIHFFNSSLLLKNDNGVNDVFFYQYDLNNNKLIQKYIKGGRGKGEAFGSLCSGIYNDKLWMFDVTAGKIIFSKIGDTIVEEHKVPYFYYNVQPFGKSKILGNDATHSIFKIQEFDFELGKETNEFGEYLDGPKGISTSAWKQANQSFLYIKPDESKIVMASRMSERLEIIDINSKESKIISGPENFKPVFMVHTKSKGEEVVLKTGNTIETFIGGTVTEKYIYLLYSGKKRQEKNSYFSSKIYVYDWNGSPVKEINLDKDVLGITVTPDDKTLFSHDVESRYVVKAKLN